MNIYVGNLAWKTRQKDLKELFENFGEVTNAFIVRDKVTRRSRGFGFVEMAEENDALQAIEKLNNTVFLDRTIIVNEALPKGENDTDDSGEEDGSDENAVTAGKDDQQAGPDDQSVEEPEEAKGETDGQDDQQEESVDPTEQPAGEQTDEPADEPVEPKAEEKTKHDEPEKAKAENAGEDEQPAEAEEDTAKKD